MTESPRSPLKWAGSKRALAVALQPWWDGEYAENRWVWAELMAGSAQMAFLWRPPEVLLVDSCWPLINFYQQLDISARVPTLDLRPTWPNDEDFYYGARRAFNELLAEGEVGISAEGRWMMARLFWYMNRVGWHGLYRVGSNGFNVPFGHYKTEPTYRDPKDYTTTIRDWRFYAGPYTAADVSSRALVYLDPPYDGMFANYGVDGFDAFDRVDLAKWARSRRGPVMISDSETAATMYLGMGFDVMLFVERTRIRGKSVPRREMIATRGLDSQRIRSALISSGRAVYRV